MGGAMTEEADDLDHVKRGAAALAVCIVQTLNESDPSFEARFLDRVSRAYAEFQDNPVGDVRHELELLAWSREFLTGFNLTTGQGKPLVG